MTADLPPVRLVPAPWPTNGTSDRYRLVDLDDNESRTVFTLIGKGRDDDASVHLLSVETYSSESLVEIDGNRVVVLDEARLPGLLALVELAHRRREDFQHHAHDTDDYSKEDVRAADNAWHLAEQASRKIRGAAA